MSDRVSTLAIRVEKLSNDENPSLDMWARKWAAFINHMDVNGDGKMDEYEFVNMTAARVRAITESAEKEEEIKVFLKETWNKWWNGFMNAENLKSFSADDVISTEAKTRAKMVDMQHLIMEVKWSHTFFELVDTDGNDCLNKTEHANFLKIFRVPFSSALFSEADTNSDGAISKSEMIIKELAWVIDNSGEGADFYGKIQ
ncbi:uncharacterized protein LOC106162172 [Lingula anatina]|uniref:Uncharacterized protein LOC106162172 n=1 Tax=Lingula anatina TaxID=7574 RepID=A0A1S3IBL7_LINAN|nr:uncharacterized protein LOC106162172 [Lingula anatina]|eukprot:XP_013394809.1 uncharacterized protein LOC106162172 [Lingula anatina]